MVDQIDTKNQNSGDILDSDSPIGYDKAKSFLNEQNNFQDITTQQSLNKSKFVNGQ